MKRIIPIILLLLIIAPAAALNDDEWPEAMEDWDHRVPITITDAPSSANVQRMINVTYQTGMQSDFDDIRPYTSAGSSIDYWIEDYVASSYAHVWVELPSASMVYIYVYYDNAAATDASDGDAVFELWGDFRTASSLDTAKFTDISANSGSVSVGSGAMTLTAASTSGSKGAVKSVDSFGTDTIIEFYGTLPVMTSFMYSEFGYSGVYLISESDRAVIGDLASSNTNWRLTTKKDGSYNYLTDYSGSDNDEHLFSIERQGTSAVVFRVDGATIGTQSSSAYIPTASMDVCIGLYRVDSGSGSQTVRYLYERTYDAAATSFVIGSPEEPPEEEGLIPFPGYELNPTDPDSDGLYEDCNANGRTDFNDLIILFTYNAWAQENQPTKAYFDWSGNSKIDFSDVVGFWETDY